MKRGSIGVLAVALTLSASVAVAGEAAIGIKAGTTGAGVELEKTLTSDVSARVGVNYFNYTYSGTVDEIDYDFDLDLKTFAALLDWHPFQGAFRISGGLVYNQNELEVTGKASRSQTYSIGGKDYNGMDVGNLHGNVDFEDFAPYVGIGVDTSFGERNQFGFLFEAGVLYQGEPSVRLTADGPIADEPVFMADLAAEERNLQEDLENYKWYPVLTIGMSYRF